MFNFGSTATPSSNTSLFGTSTPVNQNRTAGSLFGNTTAQPSALTSTPFSSTTLFGASTPATTTLQATPTGTGTIHKFDAVVGTDKINKNGIQTQIRTKIFNLCAMPVYEKKSMEELRLEDYIDNRKFASAATTMFSSTTAPTSLFGGTATNPTTTTTSLFGGTTTTATAPSALNTSFFGNKPALSTSSTVPFTFGASTAATTASASPFAFGSSTTTTATSSPFSTTAPAAGTTPSTAPFAFGSNQAPTATATPFAFGGSQATTAATATAPAFSFGSSTAFPAAASTTTTAPSFGFSVTKPATTTTFSFTPATAASTASTFNLFPTATTTATAAPTLFSASAQPLSTAAVVNAPSSVDTRTHLQLFQTMLNIQPFNSELGFLARNIKPNIGLDRARLRTAPDPTNTHSVNNVFTPLLPKSSVLTSSTSTTPSTLANPLPTHSHTLPSVLLPSSTSTTSISLFGKRKLADSFLDDDDDYALMMDDGPSLSTNKISKANVVKRPRVLDMNKIRSVVLGGGNNETITKEENLTDTYVVKPTSDNLSGWKKFANYDAYLASKNQHQQPIEPMKPVEEDKTINLYENKVELERAFRLPKLTHDDYYTKPTIDELRSCFNEKGQCFVKEFTVGREHYGSVTFQGSKMNLAGLNLNQLIEIGRRQVTVYPDDHNKPKEGDELNCPAIISLIGVYPIDRSVSHNGEEVTDPDRLIDMNYENYLRNMTNKFNGKFIDYHVYTGTWTFKVDHF